MDSEHILELLTEVRRGKVSVTEAMVRLRHLPFEDLGFAKVDSHRALRTDFPEVVMRKGIAKRDRGHRTFLRHQGQMGTSLGCQPRNDVKNWSRAQVSCQRTLRLNQPIKITGKGAVLVVCAGTRCTRR
jgi:NCAIR mutase (PurE)-related protein